MIVIASANFTRPSDTTAYANADLVANSTTAGSVVPMAFNLPYSGVKLWRAGIKFDSATPTNATFRLHLYGSSPTASNGDNAAWLTTNSDYQGFILIDASTLTFSDTTVGYNAQLTAPLFVSPSVSTGKLYGLLAATAAYTPTSAEVFTVTLYGES